MQCREHFRILIQQRYTSLYHNTTSQTNNVDCTINANKQQHTSWTVDGMSFEVHGNAHLIIVL